jgi:Icc-related predicted phosphoesterase
MRIVAVADTHMYEADLGAIPDGDVFIHAGDLCRRGSLDELAAVVPWLQRLPHRHKLVVAGNHDWCFARDPEAARTLLGDSIVYLQDAACEIDGISIWGSPWQPRYRKWAFNLERGAELAAKWQLIPAGVDVLITHGPPRGFGDRTPWPGRAGCEDLLQAARRLRPLVHLFGHIHTDGGVWYDDGITFVNATTSECERMATVLDLDIATREVRAVSVPPAKI